jgi:hypothetical protein
LRSGHVQRKNNFKFRGSETPAGVSEPHFHRKALQPGTAAAALVFYGKLISVVTVDSLLKKSLLSNTLNITNLIRRNEADHGCKNACPVENTV